MEIKCYEEPNTYLFVVSEGDNTFEYRWGKTPPEGQTLEQYLQVCKREALLLAEHEIAMKQPPQEISI